MGGERLKTLGHGFDWRVEHLDWPVSTDVGPGLRGVIAAATRVLWLDPSSGRLAYRGIPIDSLSRDADFEQVAYLLISGRQAADDAEGWAGFRDNLRSSRTLPADVVGLLRDLDPATHPTRLLRAGVSALGCHELATEDDLAGERHWRELRIVGQVAALVAEIVRLRTGRPPAPDAAGELSLAERLLASLGDGPPDADDVRTLDLLWVLYAAHGLDASTFTSMIVASCLADPYYNVVAGLSALRGPREGGAAEQVVRPADRSRRRRRGRRLGSPDRCRAAATSPASATPSTACPIPGWSVLRRRGGRGRPAQGPGRTVRGGTGGGGGGDAGAGASRSIHVNINLYGALLFHLLGAALPTWCPA